MDRSWMNKSRVIKEYQNGLRFFLDYSFRNACINGRILCPCKYCKIGISVSREEALEHLTIDGFIPGYTQWIAHGELLSNSSRSENQHDNSGTSSYVDKMEGLVNDAFGVQMEDGYVEDTTDFPQDMEIANGQARDFFKLIDASQQKLYEGFDYVETKLNRMPRNVTMNDKTTSVLDVFTITGHALGKGIPTRFDAETLKKAHQYVLFNCDDVSSYIEQYRSVVKQAHPRVSRLQLERIHSESFADWFSQKVNEGLQSYNESSKERDFKLLAGQPNFIGMKYKKFIVNGFRINLCSTEAQKKLAQRDVEESNQQLLSLSLKLEKLQKQLSEPLASEKVVCQPSNEQNFAFQSEGEAIKKQCSHDSAALASALDEIKQLEIQLEMVAESEAAQSKHSESGQNDTSLFLYFVC
ncbi:hypothetical protein C2S52_000587 [Perilla frutescens var. hirtella]|nr:hypothetical protein C2S52_000587 [Perilla frutescens var. hirtella]